MINNIEELTLEQLMPLYQEKKDSSEDLEYLINSKRAAAVQAVDEANAELIALQKEDAKDAAALKAALQAIAISEYLNNPTKKTINEHLSVRAPIIYEFEPAAAIEWAKVNMPILVTLVPEHYTFDGATFAKLPMISKLPFVTAKESAPTAVLSGFNKKKVKE